MLTIPAAIEFRRCTHCDGTMYIEELPGGDGTWRQLVLCLACARPRPRRTTLDRSAPQLAHASGRKVRTPYRQGEGAL
jgi:hypothetical protein